MHIAIVDSVKQDRLELRRLIGQYSLQKKVACEVDEYSSGDAFLMRFSPGRYQIVILDVYLDEMSGIAVAERICELDPACRIVFFTSSPDFAVESYRFHALYYLTKPLDYQRLCDALNRFGTSRPDQPRRLQVQVGGIRIQLPLQDILYINVEGRRLCIHLKDQLISSYERFSDIAERLKDEVCFLCCNRGVLVNMDWIKQVLDHDFLLKNGVRIPIRVRSRSALKKTFLEYSMHRQDQNALLEAPSN